VNIQPDDMEANLSSPSEAPSPCSPNIPDYTIRRGDPTEVCILRLAVQIFPDHASGVRSLRRTYPRQSELPFDSSNKYMATLHRVPRKKFVELLGREHHITNQIYTGGVNYEEMKNLDLDADKMVNVIFLKGAVEKVLTFCSNTVSNEEKTVWLEQSQQLAMKGMRVLALAYGIVSSDMSLPSFLIFFLLRM
jgi:magnesium-transporting ATPase (P-type)